MSEIITYLENAREIVQNAKGIISEIVEEVVENAVEKAKEIQDAEDRLLKALENGDDTLYDTLINPATGMPYTEAEKAIAIENAIDREIQNLETNRPISPEGQARLDELKETRSNMMPNDPALDPDNKDATFSVADDDDGIRADYEAFNQEGSVYSDEWGNDHANASVDVLGYEASSGAFVEFGGDEIEAGAHASASANIVSGEANVEAGPLEASAEGSVGAHAEAEANVEFDLSEVTARAELGGEAFAGAEVEGSLGADLGVAEVEAGIEAKAGIGVEAELDAGYEDGKLNIETDIGAAFGVGLGIDYSVSVDVEGIASGAADAAEWTVDKAGDAIGKVGDVAGDAIDKAGDIAGGAIDKAGDAIDKAGDFASGAVDKAKDFGDAVTFWD